MPIDAPNVEGLSADRGIAGVRSRSDARRMVLAGAEPVTPDDPKVSDWVFVFAAAVPASAPEPAPAPAAPPARKPRP
jgi:hypothetical protein